MITDLKPYPEYKESGLPWLGQVPGHWEERRLRSLATESICNGVGESAQEFREDWPRYIRITDIADARTLRRRTRASLPPSMSIGADVHRGDLLIAAVGATFGKAYVHASDEEACFAGYLVRVRLASELDPDFTAYWTESQHYWHQLRANVIQSTIQNFSAARVKRLLAILPPPAEQAAIVRFLDWANGRLERAIRAKRKVIALLNEQKQAIIHRAVNRGLDPSVPLKDSGVPWLGEIPQHWEQRALWSLSNLRTERNPGHLELLSVFLDRGVIRYVEGGGQVHAPSLDLSNYQVVRRGDFVLNNQQAWRGSVGVSMHEGIISPAYIVLALSNRLHPLFANYLMRSRAMVDQFVAASKGVGDIQRQVFWPFLRMVQVPLPSMNEQQSIVGHLEQETAGLMRTISRLEREITLLREYRTRLVADVVTGKLDVRAAAAALPDEAPIKLESDSELETDEPEGTADEEAP